MPADADTGLTSGENQLDGKPIGGVNIFSPEELEKSGMTLDAPENDDDFIDLDEKEDDEDEDEPEAEVDDAKPDEDEGDLKLIEKYKTPEALAKALRHAQRKLSEQGNELGQYRGREGALLELVKRAGVDKDASEQKQDDDGVPRDEYGIPKPADGYWKDVYLPQLKDFYTKRYVDDGYEETEARVLATADAVEHMVDERTKWRESYDAQRAAAISQRQASEEEEVRQNSTKQEEAISQEREKITGLCAKMGVDPDEGFKKVMEVAGQMVTRAHQLGQISLVQASKPETAVQAIWGAWAYLQSQGGLPEGAPQAQRAAHAPTAGRSTGGAPPKPRVPAATQSAGSYSKAHNDFAQQLGLTPEEMEKKYGRL